MTGIRRLAPNSLPGIPIVTQAKQRCTHHFPVARRPVTSHRILRTPRMAITGGSTGSEKRMEYKTSATDMAFIGMCRKAYGRIAGFQSSRDWRDGDETYAGMLEVSRALMKGRSAMEQRQAVIQGFPRVPQWFRKVFPYSRWGAELNARITPAFFTWLVGPMQTEEAVADKGVVQQSGVRIECCRYLAESNCAGMCVNLCKTPVQTFFTKELGMPLTMKPNFEDYSCEMVFGLTPPAIDEDEALQQACLQDCSTAISDKTPCHKYR